ncbi:MAG: hypothetical protein AB8H86_07090 [Polyangiales bacterium]
MKRSLALLIFFAAVALVCAPRTLSAQDAPAEAPILAEMPVETPSNSSDGAEASRFSPSTVAAAVDHERPPLRERLSSPELVQRRRQVRRVRVRRALIATAVLTGVVAASVGASKLIEREESASERDGQGLLGLLILLGAV